MTRRRCVSIQKPGNKLEDYLCTRRIGYFFLPGCVKLGLYMVSTQRVTITVSSRGIAAFVLDLLELYTIINIPAGYVVPGVHSKMMHAGEG